MTQFSGFWTTSGTPSGHQVASYDQADYSVAFRISAGARNYEGIIGDWRNECAPSTTGANNARVAPGGAMVDGKFYDSDANVDVNIPTPSAGNERIDRIVLRADWAGFQVTVFRIAGTEAASPTVPAITQTSGTTYDITVCQARINDTGTVTITDERTFAGDIDNLSLEITGFGKIQVLEDGINSSHLAANSVTATQIAADAVGASEIAAGAVGTSELAADAVTNAKIANDQIDSEHYVAGSIDAEHLASSSVTAAKIAANAVTNAKIAAAAVDTAELAADAVDDTKVGDRVAQFYRRQGGSASDWAIDGDTTQTPTSIRTQFGTKAIVQSGSITFPVAFSNKPIFLATCLSNTPTQQRVVMVQAVTSTNATVIVFDDADNQSNADVFWMAIGPE